MTWKLQLESLRCWIYKSETLDRILDATQCYASVAAVTYNATFGKNDLGRRIRMCWVFATVKVKRMNQKLVKKNRPWRKQSYVFLYITVTSAVLGSPAPPRLAFGGFLWETQELAEVVCDCLECTVVCTYVQMNAALLPHAGRSIVHQEYSKW